MLGLSILLLFIFSVKVSFVAFFVNCLLQFIKEKDGRGGE